METSLKKSSDIRRNNILQLVLALVIIILINIIGSFIFTRIDLTTEKRYFLVVINKETPS